MKTTVGELKKKLAELDDDTPIHIGLNLESDEESEHDHVVATSITEITHQQGHLFIQCEGKTH